MSSGSVFQTLRDQFGLALDARARAMLRQVPGVEIGLERVLVGETSFFRHPTQLEVLMDVVLPDRLAARGSEPVRVLSAGCSCGAEPASVAILLHERMPESNRKQVQITGVDLSEAALKIAREGTYTPWHLRHVPPALRRRWFEGPDAARLRSSIRDTIHYRRDNLLTTELLIRRSWDVVLCRNVLIHLTPSARHVVLERIIEALRPGGWLLTGPSDLLVFRHPQLEVQRFGRALVHRRIPVAGGALGPAEEAFATANVRRIPAQPTPPSRSRPPLKPIRAPRPSRRRPPTASSQQAPAHLDLRPLVALVAAERHQDALDRIGPYVAPSGEIVRATALLHLGRLDEAEAACWRALSAAPELPDAHHVLSLARVARGDSGGARDHVRAAIYLDARFALAHLHAANLADALGDRDAARRHLLRARALLPRESDPHVLLFGGGFDRHALATLCEARLRTLRGP